MAITGYTGPPGSGKSYALVSEVIVPAARHGRRVITNVAGVKPEAIAAYIAKKWPGTGAGEVIVVDGRTSLDPGFFPDPEAPGSTSVVHAGDLVVLDEIGIYWPKRGKFPDHVLRFLRWHRHCVEPHTGQSTDLALATQRYTDFHLDARGLFEASYKFKKLATLGMNSSFAWSMWEGGSQAKGEAVQNGTGKYRQEVFDLYKSYDGAGGLESATDKRRNVLRDPKLLMFAGGIGACAIAGVLFLVSVFTGGDDVKKAAPGGAQQVAAGTPGVAPAKPPMSSQWRIAGVVRHPNLHAVVLADRAGSIRLEHPSGFTFDGERPVSGLVDGATVITTPPAQAGGMFSGVLR